MPLASFWKIRENAIFPIETKKQSINQSLAKATEWRSERETEN